MTRAIYRVWW